MPFQDRESQPLTCSFCQKTQHEVDKLVAGPNVYICDRCVSACQDLIGAEALKSHSELTQNWTPKKEK